MKVLLLALKGAIVSAFIFGVGAAAILIVLDTTSGAGVISIRDADFWWLGLILGALFGVAIGGIEGLVVGCLPLLTIFFGLAVGFMYLLSFVFDVTAAWDENWQMFMRLFVIWQVIYPIIISLTFRREQL